MHGRCYFRALTVSAILLFLFVLMTMFMKRDQRVHKLMSSYKVEVRYDEQGASLPGLNKRAAARVEGNDPSPSVDLINERQLAYGKPVYDGKKAVMSLSMPKCGTRTLTIIFLRLSRINHFGNPIIIKTMLDQTSLADARREIDGKLANASDGSILHGHYRYVDMGGARKKPILISIIRDPVSRFVSHFYYMRYGDPAGDKRGIVHRVTDNETVDDCVEKMSQDCNSSYFRFMYVNSFCGYDVKCSNPSYALQRAKQNVDRFLVIGITEEYDLSLRVFEKLLPATFRGSLKVYSQIKKEAMKRFKTSFKKPASPKTCSHLRNWLEKEYEFYDYVKEKFYRLVRRLGVRDT